MGIFDFYLTSSSLFDKVYPLVSYDASMMPEQFWLKVDEEATWHMIFEVELLAQDLSLHYKEVGAKGIEGTTYTVDIS